MTQAVIELYPKEIREIPAHESKSSEFRTLAMEIGFTNLATGGWKMRDEARTWCNRHELAPLTEEELSAWREYLPTSYWSSPDKALREANVRPLDFSEYAFHEGVPLTVLQRMKVVGKLFDVLEIRTPEKPKVVAVADPALWGHIIRSDGTREIYPLARWAESDANFISGVEDLKKILHARRGALLEWPMTELAPVTRSLVALPCMTATLFSVASWGLAFLWSGMPYGLPAFLAGGAFGLMLGITNYMSYLSRRTAIRKEHPQLARFV